MKNKLKREKQCAKCPWKKKTNPHEIPNGYCKKKHKKLKITIASQDVFSQLANRSVRTMSCHEEVDGHCIGWLINQLGPGNNIGLRIQMLDYDLSNVETFGEQHETFEETLP